MVTVAGSFAGIYTYWGYCYFHFFFIYSMNFQHLGNNYLSIEKLELDDEGDYSCEATDNENCGSEKTAHLSVFQSGVHNECKSNMRATGSKYIDSRAVIDALLGNYDPYTSRCLHNI